MTSSKSTKPAHSGDRAEGTTASGGPLGIVFAAALLLILLGFMFHESFDPAKVHFSSDGPLGAASADFYSVPGIFSGVWQDLNWLGGWAGAGSPNITNLLLWLLKPVAFAKFYPPICLFLLGLSIWCFCRTQSFHPMVCCLAAVAGSLNTDFLSYACWGLGPLPLAVGLVFLGMAALTSKSTHRLWLRASLAGLAVGMAVLEGLDAGAILSLYVAGFVLSQALRSSSSGMQRWWSSFAQLALVSIVAAFVAYQGLITLVGTQIQGVVGMSQDQRSKSQQWDQATMWSLPKLETLRIVVPGLFGYRMDTPDGGNYWGSVGQQPGVIQSRHSGSGVYGGVLVVVVAAWGLGQSLRRKGNPFSHQEKRIVWFWGGAMVASLALAWGRHAPFYQLFYALPYASTMRNPIKFMHPFHIGLVVLFAYGLQALWSCYLQKPRFQKGSMGTHFRSWWRSAVLSDRRAILCLLASLATATLGWMLYAASRTELETFLQKAVQPGNLASAIAGFSLREVGWSVFLLALVTVFFTATLSGLWSGSRTKWAWLVAGLLLVADLGRANLPWIYYWNYHEKYALNPVLEVLRSKPFEQRVAVLPLQVNEQLTFLQQFYHSDWLQHSFPFYNIQSIDLIQEPRTAADNDAFRRSFRSASGLLRQWQLTNVRYILGLAGGLSDMLNQQLDPVEKRFRTLVPFTFEQSKEGAFLVKTNREGPFALMEFQGSLPRAKLYTQWSVVTNSQETLSRLADPAYDPAQVVLTDVDPGPTGPSSSTNAPSLSEVEFTSYSPKLITLTSSSESPCVLLLNDKHDPKWVVKVDGLPRPLLRCNFLMRGVYLPPGKHTVEFSFQVPTRPLLVSVLAIFLGLVLLGLLVVDSRKEHSLDRTKENAGTSDGSVQGFVK